MSKKLKAFIVSELQELVVIRDREGSLNQYEEGKVQAYSDMLELLTLEAKKKVAAPSGKVLSHTDAYGRPVYFSTAMSIIIKAGKAGKIKRGVDWLPAYLANLPVAKMLEAAKNEPTPAYGNIPYEELTKAREAYNARVAASAAAYTANQRWLWSEINA